ncbi:MAG: hypothetical protein IV104_19825 [Acidovorax sp.]|nr:hypothetical protein [Acidovorax sp.]
MSEAQGPKTHYEATDGATYSGSVFAARKIDSKARPAQSIDARPVNQQSARVMFDQVPAVMKSLQPLLEEAVQKALAQ